LLDSSRNDRLLDFCAQRRAERKTAGSRRLLLDRTCYDRLLNDRGIFAARDQT
jgi:hypothetical protein